MPEIDPTEARRRIDAGEGRAWAEDRGAIVRDDRSPGVLD